MKKKYVLVLVLVFMFFYFLFFNLILMPTTHDEIWNYGFAYDISLGLIPYRDFNMVITPLYPALMALFFLIFGHNMLVLYIANSLFLTLGFYFIFKLLGKKGLLLFIFFFVPSAVLTPTYNIFAFVLLMIIFYMEKEKNNDFVIGIMLGLLILTKQSIGALVLMPGVFYYYKDKKRMLKRGLGCFFILIIFVLYLLITKSFMPFLDLCLFGLFDFASGNGQWFTIYTLLTIFIYAVTIYFIKKDPKNIYNYYAMAFYTVVFPLFDDYHFHIAFMAFLFICLYYLPDKIRIKYGTITIFFIIIIPVLIFCMDFYQKKVVYPNDLNNYQYRIIDYESYLLTKTVSQYLKEHSQYDYVFLEESGYYFKILEDKKIGYLDLINEGNWGYNGNKKMLDALSKKKNDTLIFVNPNKLKMGTQTNLNLIYYVMDNGKKIDSVLFYDVYILE